MKAGYLIGYVIIVLAYILERSFKAITAILAASFFVSCANYETVIQKHVVDSTAKGIDFRPIEPAHRQSLKSGDTVIFVSKRRQYAH